MKTAILSGFVVVLIVLALVLVPASTYTLDETEQSVVVQFGKPVGEPVTTPGLHFKVPFIQDVRRFERRLLAWDGDPNQIPTRGREFIAVDTTARWRIVDPLLFLQSVKDQAGAQSRLDDIIDSAVRDQISSHNLVEIVRSEGSMPISEGSEPIPVESGRQNIEKQILALTHKQMPQLGIELVDVRIKRVNYVASVQQEIFERMIAERQRIAAQFRAEGEREAKVILGETHRDEAEIRSDAERQAQITRGEADAEAIRIYNEAYSADPDFFAFQRTLESYVKSLSKDTTLIIGTDSDYFKFLRRIEPEERGVRSEK